MPRPPAYVCPVCWRDVVSVNINFSSQGQINGHCDGAGYKCPGGLQPFYIAIRKPETTLKQINGNWELRLVN